MGGALQGNPLSSYTNVVTTLTGSPGFLGSTNGTSLAARFDYPFGITTDGPNLYVTDTHNYIIRKIVISTGDVTTIAGTAGSSGSTDGIGSAARFNYPAGITTDGANLYVADVLNSTIRKIVISTGDVTTIAGTAGSYGSTDGTGTTARFNAPAGITTDGTNLYVADTYNNTIRKIVISTGDVTTIAGTAGSYGSTDGTGPTARFNSPYGITTDGTNLYMADIYNYTVRKIVISTGVVTTIAGTAGSTGSADGTGPAASFSNPIDVTTDGTNLYVANYSSIRKIVISTGVVTTLAGTIATGATDGTGSAARFYSPYGITTDGTNLFVADYYNSTIRKISVTTTVPSSAPTNVIAGAGNGQITIAWDNVTGALCYNLYCAPGTSVTEATGTKIASVASPYTYTGLTNGTTYACIETAVNNNGEGPASGPLPSTPVASHTLSISKGGTGSGTVSSSPSGISCGATCSAAVTNGTAITLTATADSGSTFVGWSGGGCSGTGACTVAMTSDQAVTATFNSTTTTLTVSKSGTGSGTVSSSPSGISCGATCSESATTGTTVTLTATPASGSTFGGWSGGGCSGTGSCTVTMSSNQAITATFTASSSGGYYWANWSCSSAQCATAMGAYSGSAGPLCTLTDCTAWRNTVNSNSTCDTTATSANITTGTPANGVCYQSGVDF